MVPKLDLSKAKKFANLSNPYAYLEESSKSKTNEDLSNAVIEMGQVKSMKSSSASES